MSISTRVIDLTGQTYGTLLVVAQADLYEHPSGNQSRWYVICDCGVTKIVRGNHMRKGQTVTCGNRKAHPHGIERHYNTVHQHLREAKGKAEQHRCVDCGLRAKDWSHIHDTDPMDIECYEPRCRMCHSQYDRAIRTAV